jgi:WD40 repeat protein
MLLLFIGQTCSTYPFILKEVSYRKDFKEDISDIKFSPNNDHLAVGSHDDFIIIYTCLLSVDKFSGGSCVLKPLHKLNGHSSYITHIGKYNTRNMNNDFNIFFPFFCIIFDVENFFKYFISAISYYSKKFNRLECGWTALTIELWCL